MGGAPERGGAASPTKSASCVVLWSESPTSPRFAPCAPRAKRSGAGHRATPYRVSAGKPCLKVSRSKGEGSYRLRLPATGRLFAYRANLPRRAAPAPRWQEATGTRPCAGAATLPSARRNGKLGGARSPGPCSPRRSGRDRAGRGGPGQARFAPVAVAAPGVDQPGRRLQAARRRLGADAAPGAGGAETPCRRQRLIPTALDADRSKLAIPLNGSEADRSSSRATGISSSPNLSDLPWMKPVAGWQGPSAERSAWSWCARARV